MYFRMASLTFRGRALGATVLLAGALFAAMVDRSHGAGVSWGYSGGTGPEHWGRDFPVCGMGRNQSPIDVDPDRVLDISELVTAGQTLGSRPAGFLKIEAAYEEIPLRIINNGHAVEVLYDPGSTMQVHGRARELKQFHFHSPSENQIGGESFPMEVHLVHADENDNLTVIGILFREGEPNPFIGKLWAHLPKQANVEVAVSDTKINASDLLPEDMRYYYYNGSLTTPPCSEGVSWLLLKEPVEASREQLDAIRSALGFDNNRPVQPQNSRVVIGW